MNSPWIFSVGEQDFDARVLQASRDKPVVVDFWAPWCGPCRMLGPALERLIEQRGGEVLMAKVNTDEEQMLAAQYQIQVLPTVIAFRDGRPVLDFEGLLPEPQLSAFLDRLLPSEAERKAKEGADLEKKDPQQAERLYRQALQKDHNQEAALLGLVRILIEQNQDGEAAELLDRVGAGGENGAEAERLGAILWLRKHAHERGDEATLKARLERDPNDPMTLYDLGCVEAAAGRYPQALELLLKAGQRDAKLAKGKVREAMVKVFHVVGVRSALADEYRDKLAALLY